MDQMNGWIRRHIVLAAVLIAGAWQPATGQTAETPTSRALVDALRSGGLRAAAELVGQYKGINDFQMRAVVDDLFALARFSDLVVRARAVNSWSPRLSRDGDSISTDYQFVIEERFQEPLVDGSSIRVRLDLNPLE
jgi:hypothetical protein